MSRKNKNNMGSNNNFTAGNDINQTFNKSNQNNIDNSTTVYQTVYTMQKELDIMSWADPLNNEALFYKRLPNINDRPMLEHYYKLFELKDEMGVSYKITKAMVFYVYIVEKRSNLNYAGINLINEFGDKLAAHIIIKGVDLSKYLNKLIKFTGVIYPYDEDNEDGETKYSVKIFESKGIEIVEGKQHTLGVPPWDMFIDSDMIIDIDELNRKYNELDIDVQMYLLETIEDKLNVISTNMFNVPNLIFPIVLTNFLMRDDIYNEKVLSNNVRFLNIVSTMVADYILKIKPKTFDETVKIINYVVMNFLGYDLETPEDKTKFYNFATYLRVSIDNASLYLSHAKENSGGVKSILNYIPDNYKIKPGNINEVATIQFLKRMMLELEI